MKLDLTEELAATLRQLRLDHPVNGEVFTAEKLSNTIGNNRAWMSQIESRRLKKIKREDIIKIYKVLFGYEDNETAEDKAEVDLLRFLGDGRKGKMLITGSPGRVPLQNKEYNEEQHEKKGINSEKSLEKNEKKIFKIYNDNCKEFYDTLLYLYSKKENLYEKCILTSKITRLLRLFDSLCDDDSYIDLISTIPFDLYRFADENDQDEIKEKVYDLADALEKIRYRKVLDTFIKRTEYILEELSKKRLKMKSINDSIIVCIFELNDILYKYPAITTDIKASLMNKYINVLNLYAQKNSLIFILEPLPENNCNMTDINNALDYIQSFVNGIKDSYAYILNHMSDNYQE